MFRQIWNKSKICAFTPLAANFKYPFNSSLKSVFNRNLFTFCTHIMKYDVDARQSELNKYARVEANTIQDNKRARILKTIRGRGPGSGKGKTSTRGHKGYTGRTGEPARHYEGGSTSILKRVPKRGFNRRGRIKTQYIGVNLRSIIYHITKGNLDPSKVITIKELYKAGVISKFGDGVKLLGRGSHLLQKYPNLTFEVSDAAKKTIDQVKKNGGQVLIKYRTKLTLRNHVKPEKFKREVLDPIPPSKRVEKLEHLKDKGAEVSYVAPSWIIAPKKLADKKIRLEVLKKKLNKQKHTELLPDYPLRDHNDAGSGDKLYRKRKKQLIKKVILESK